MPTSGISSDGLGTWLVLVLAGTLSPSRLRNCPPKARKWVNKNPTPNTSALI